MQTIKGLQKRGLYKKEKNLVDELPQQRVLVQ